MALTPREQYNSVTSERQRNERLIDIVNKLEDIRAAITAAMNMMIWCMIFGFSMVALLVLTGCEYNDPMWVEGEPYTLQVSDDPDDPPVVVMTGEYVTTLGPGYDIRLKTTHEQEGSEYTTDCYCGPNIPGPNGRGNVYDMIQHTWKTYLCRCATDIRSTGQMEKEMIYEQ